jgi:hypothetical protein
MRQVKRRDVVWLGGNARFWPTAREFNLRQDPAASRVLFDSGVAFGHHKSRVVARCEKVRFIAEASNCFACPDVLRTTDAS